MDLDFQRIKQFYAETWWLWTLYAVGIFLAIWKVSLIFISAIPIILLISLYFAIVRGPSPSPNDQGEQDADQGDLDSESQDEAHPEAEASNGP